MTHKTTLDRDATTKPLGSHPVGTGVGAAAGGIAGARHGGRGRRIVGRSGWNGRRRAWRARVVGGLAGKGIAELVDPAAEDAYWRDTYSDPPRTLRAARASTTTARRIAMVSTATAVTTAARSTRSRRTSRATGGAPRSFEALLGEREACDARLLGARQRCRRARDSGRLRSRRQMMPMMATEDGTSQGRPALITLGAPRHQPHRWGAVPGAEASRISVASSCDFRRPFPMRQRTDRTAGRRAQFPCCLDIFQPLSGGTP